MIQVGDLAGMLALNVGVWGSCVSSSANVSKLSLGQSHGLKQDVVGMSVFCLALVDSVQEGHHL